MKLKLPTPPLPDALTPRPKRPGEGSRNGDRNGNGNGNGGGNGAE